jgi:hypothetical protein
MYADQQHTAGERDYVSILERRCAMLITAQTMPIGNDEVIQVRLVMRIIDRRSVKVIAVSLAPDASLETV